MGYYESSCLVDDETPSENRVVGSERFSSDRARLPASQPLESHLEITITLTISVSDRQSFWTIDAWEGSLADPRSLHSYLYCSDSPVGLSDPSGMAFIPTSLAELMAAVGIDATVDKPFRAGTAYYGRRAIIKVGCVIAEDLISSAIAEAVYILILDKGAAGLMYYVGQTGRAPDPRLMEHFAKYRTSLKKVAAVFNLKGWDKTEREIFETIVKEFLEEQGNTLANQRSPVGTGRRAILEKAGKFFNLKGKLPC